LRLAPIFKIAGVEKLGNSITVTVGDLTGNHLPNLLIGRDDGTVLYALNTGKLGAPEFITPGYALKRSPASRLSLRLSEGLD
jgi:hypothetical protein